MKRSGGIILSLAIILSMGTLPVGTAANSGTAFSVSAESLPEAPEFFSYSYNSEKDSVTFSWNAVGGADKYVLYQYKNKTWERIKVTDKRTVTFSGFKKGASYKFKAAAVVKKSDGKYYRGKFCEPITVILNEDSSASEIVQEETPKKQSATMTTVQILLTDYYRAYLSADTEKAASMGIASSQAVLAPAGVGNSEIMLVTQYYTDGSHAVCMYGVSGGKVMQVGGLPFASSTSKVGNDIWFVKDKRNGKYYLNYVYLKYTNGTEVVIGLADASGVVVPVIKLAEMGNGSAYLINDEIVETDEYSKAAANYEKCDTGTDSIVILA